MRPCIRDATWVGGGLTVLSDGVLSPYLDMRRKPAPLLAQILKTLNAPRPMTAARILILTSGALCANPRVLKEARTLSAFGYDVTVINPNTSRAHAEADMRMLARSAYKQQVLAFDHRLQTRAITWLARRALRLGLDFPRALGPTHGLLEAARRSPADLVIVHNEVAHWAGLRLLREGRNVAADIEDWHSEDLSVQSRRYRPLATLRRQERALLHNARYCTTTSEVMANTLFARYGGQRPTVLTNSFPLQANCPPRPLGAPVSFFWFSQTIGPDRGLEQLMRAWGQATGTSELHLLGSATPSYLAFLRAMLPETHTSRLHIHPLVHPEELPGVIARHDVGLAIEISSIPNRNLTITNKILQYCNAGLALLASKTLGQQEVLANAPNAGLLIDVGNHEEFRDAISRLANDRAAIELHRTTARELAVRKYSWEHEEPTLLNLVQEALRVPSS